MPELREIYREEGFPTFQNRMFETYEEALASPRGDVVLCQDMGTGLVFNSAFDPNLMDYDDSYQNEQAHSESFRNHLEVVADIVKRYLPANDVLEVGCGKGYFLDVMRSSGIEARGVDPTYDGPDETVIREYFTAELGIRASGVVLRHVLEHVQDPLSFLQAIAGANGNAGRIYIEVPCFDWIVENRAWFDIFYEHVNYFRLVDFEGMFGEIVDIGHVFSGQYLYVVAELGSLRKPAREPEDLVFLPEDFTVSVDRLAAQITRARGSGGQQVAIWGAASKGVILALLMERAGTSVDMIIDINPAKQGQFLAATGYRVSSPEEAMAQLSPGAVVLVVNPVYVSEVVALTQGVFDCYTLDETSLKPRSI